MSPTRSRKVPLGFTLVLCTAFLFLIAPLALAVSNADIEVTKSSDVSTIAAGGTITYTITVTNHGPNGANKVVIEDDVPSTLTNVQVSAVTQPSDCAVVGNVITCNMEGLGGSNSVNTIVFTADVVGSTETGTTITNCAFELSSQSNDPDHTNDSSPHSCGQGVEVVVQADLVVTKTQTSPTPGGTVSGATDITYHVDVTNNGPSTAANVQLTDSITSTLGAAFKSIDNITTNLDCFASPPSALPFTCTATSLANGASASFDLTVTVDNPSALSDTLTNQAAATTDTDDPDTQNNTSSVTTDICQSVDLTLAKTCTTFCPPQVSGARAGATRFGNQSCTPVEITTITGGDTFVYHVVITNNDTLQAADNVVFDDALPAGVSYVSDNANCDTGTIPLNTCAFTSIAASGNKTFDIVVTAVESGPVNNSATVSADQCDRNTADDTSSCEVTVATNNMPTALEVDREGCTNVSSPFCTGDPDSVATDSNVNRVFDGPGPNEVNELVRMDPTWENTLDNAVPVTGTIDTFTGPGDGGGHAVYTISDNTADYGSIPAHSSSDCNAATGDCYGLHLVLDDPINRPAQHWDATVHEALNTGETKTWTLHIGGSFPDVLLTNIFYRAIETIYHNHIALGCQNGFCPNGSTRRDELAAFVGRSDDGTDAAVPVSGTGYNCIGGGTSNFTDVDPTSVFCRHINFLFVHNIAIGCGGGLFCPANPVLREDAAVFIARGMNIKASQPAEPVANFGTDGGTRSYNCDPVNIQGGIPANTPPFPDVATGGEPCPAIGFLWVNHVVNGDVDGNFRPGDPIRRDEAATILSSAFVSLPLYGPNNP